MLILVLRSRSYCKTNPCLPNYYPDLNYLSQVIPYPSFAVFLDTVSHEHNMPPRKAFFSPLRDLNTLASLSLSLSSVVLRPKISPNL